MKILQLVQKPQRRGAEVFAFQLSQELRRQGHQVRTVYLYPYQGPGALAVQTQDWVLFGQEGHPFEKFPGFHPRLLHGFKQVIQEFQPDVVQVNGARTVKYGAFARQFRQNQSWVLIYRNIGQPQDWVRGWRRHLFYKKLIMPKVSGIIGVSQATLQTVKDFYNLTIPMVFVPNGVDPQLAPAIPAEVARHNTQTPLNAPVLLFVGSLTPEKRVDRLLRVMAQVQRCLPHVHLWLVGDGSLRLELEQQAEALGIAHCVHFLGVQADVATYMSAADLFVLTSDSEGIPAVILEAGLLGLPVVATRVGGIPECVLDEETGLLVDPQDEPALVQTICTLLQDQARCDNISKNAKMWIRANFTMDKIAERYIDFYQQVLAHERPSRNIA